MRDQIRLRQYLVTLHADEEMNSDGLTIFDVESAILTGSVIERQRDPNTNQLKYLVRGQSVDGSQVVVAAAKFGGMGKLVIITVYME